MVNQAVVAKTLKLVIGMRDKRGFTLIEIMVVLIIIGTAATFAVLSFGDFGKSKQAKSAAEQMVQYISLLQQKAILENRLLGITIHPNGYQAKKYIPSKGWQTINNSRVYQEQPLPNGLQFQLSKSMNESVNIVIQTSGDITPFDIYIADTNKKKMIQVHGKANGGLSIHAQS